MNESYQNAIQNHGATLLTHIGLVNGSGTEISGGGYTRKAVSWTAAAAGLIRPTADLEFTIPAGATVAGWRAFTASTAGTNHGGGALTSATYGNAGTYTLTAASTGIDINNA
jgi:hypothetical protein